MCLQGGVVADRGGRREQRGQRRGSAESDGPRPCEALLGLSSALLNGAAHTPLQHPQTLPYPPTPNPPLPSGTARAEQYKTIRRRETGRDHPDTHTHTHTHTNTPIMATRRRPQHESCSWKGPGHTYTHMHTHTLTHTHTHTHANRVAQTTHTEVGCMCNRDHSVFH